MTNVVFDTINISNTCFENNQTINSVDCKNLPWVNNSMYNAFFNCCSLNLITNINQNVTNMYGTFWNCTNLVNAPVIPNNVTNLSFCFPLCHNLVNAPVIPNSVTDISGTFQHCYNLVNAPIIPNSVIQMIQVFYSCTNLTGNIYIKSENIKSAYECFNNTSLTKNVYIPFKYTNNEYTNTYNSFINAGYDKLGTNCGVYLKDINEHTYKLNVTDYNYTNTKNDIVLTEYIGINPSVIVPTMEEE